MKALVVSFVMIVFTFSALPVAAQSLNSVKVHAGMANLEAIASGKKRLPLSEPTVALEPPFDSSVKSYKVHMPYGVDGVTLVVEASNMGKFGIIDFNGAKGFRVLNYTRGSFTKGQVMSFRLKPGDNRLRLGAKFINVTVYEFAITRANAPSSDASLVDLKLRGGELSPPFNRNTRTYRTRIVGNSLTVTPTPRAGTVALRGTRADGRALDVSGSSVSGLTAGENRITIAVRAEDGTRKNYTLVVEASVNILEVDAGDVISWPKKCNKYNGCDGTLNGIAGRFACFGRNWRSTTASARSRNKRDCSMRTEGGVVARAAGWVFAARRTKGSSSDASLAALKLRGGELSPAFNRNTRTYRTHIVGNRLTVMPTPRFGSVAIRGTGADGRALGVNGNSVSGLTAGENGITIAVRAEDGTRKNYTLVVEANVDVREVAAGDVISWPGRCNRHNGCDGTLNGVAGRFACFGKNWSSEIANMRIRVEGGCIIQIKGGVVTDAIGWVFAAFPAGRR